MFAIFALAFWYGSVVVQHGQCTFSDMFKSMMGIVFMGMMLGQVTSLAPDYVKADAAGRWLYSIISTGEKKSDANGKRLTPSMDGDIVFEDVCFTYPTRPEAMVTREKKKREEMLIGGC